MKTSKCYVFRIGYRKGVGHHHLVLAETQMQVEERENSIAEKMEGSDVYGWKAAGLGKL